MPNDLIRYDLLVQEALCGVVKRVLGDIARQGELPGEHHFYITFRTHAPGVRLSSRMREQYPEEMTIILQHQYENLRVTDTTFEVGLSFKSIPEVLVVPFDSLTGFFDPSVPFNFKFEPQPDVEAEEAGEPGAAPASGPRALPSPAPTPLAAVPKPAAKQGETGRERPAPLKLKPVETKPSGSKPFEPKPAETKPAEKKNDDTDPVEPAAAEQSQPGKVVSIDAFRKKP